MESVIEILKSNVGFDHPEKWVDYAAKKNFKFVPAKQIPRCPDCGSEPRGALGQYVYYSTLLRLKVCSNCDLIWSDAAIDPAVINAHFEFSYKDETYFEERRRDIFQHLAGIIAARSPQSGSVLDIGGGMGHLMDAVRSIRKDLQLVVQDVSAHSIEYAKNRFSLETLCGTMTQIGTDRKYDVVVLSDSLYYEDGLNQFWQLLPSILKPGGAVIIRVPNKLLWIRLSSAFHALFSSPTRDTIRFFNPEHKYILSRKYLRRRMEGIGFEVESIPSPSLIPKAPVHKIAGRTTYFLSVLLNKIAGFVMTPSMVIVARSRS